MQHGAQGSTQGELLAADSTTDIDRKGQDCRAPFKISPEQGLFAGYSTTTITVDFEPTSVAEFEEDIEIVCAVKQKETARAAPDIFRVHLQV
jgi:hypothetical protein